jgi:hypothetical protein
MAVQVPLVSILLRLMKDVVVSESVRPVAPWAGQLPEDGEKTTHPVLLPVQLVVVIPCFTRTLRWRWECKETPSSHALAHGDRLTPGRPGLWTRLVWRCRRYELRLEAGTYGGELSGRIQLEPEDRQEGAPPPLLYQEKQNVLRHEKGFAGQTACFDTVSGLPGGCGLHPGQ